MAFCREVLGVEPWEKQVAILEAINREPRVTVRSCHGAGKTICAAWVCLWFLMTRPGSIVVTTAPTMHQVKDLLWRRLRAAFAKARVGLPGRCLTTMLELDTEWYAMGMATDEEVNFQGPHSPHGVMQVGDEASGLKEWVFDAMAGTMTEPGAKQFLIGNPNQALGTFYESHRTWPASQKFHISAFDVPPHVLRSTWKEERLVDWGADSPAYLVRVLGKFPPQGEDSLISLQWVEDAQQRVPAPAGHYEMGVDVAEMGGDESCVYLRHGSAVLGFKGWRNNDPLESAGQVIAFYNETIPDAACRIKIDDIGLGSGTKAALKKHFEETKVKVQGLNVGEAAYNQVDYRNRKAEIWCGLRDHLKAGTISLPPEDHILVAQLTAIRYQYTAKGQVQIERKEDLKKRLGASRSWTSPDRADALALCFAHVRTGGGIGASAGPAREAGWRSRNG